MHPPVWIQLLVNLGPSYVFNIVFAVFVFITARKRRINSVGWTLGTLIPFLGLLIGGIFQLNTMLSILNRLDALETFD
jgi:hypothetical protein